ncbi:50S ribosomal protein L31 [Granulosicoccus sp. 3-233]|uniref:50S ribosomal protein L31 n=1 Tax=Granulosicoccus sp. 3-233 TaxID=3417969 RepID=UPI003D33D1A6
MKKHIHPVLKPTVFACGNCGTEISTASTRSDHASLEVCSNCHPAYTGKVVTSVSGSRVDAFHERYGVR